MLPVALELGGRRVVVVGAGRAGLGKAAQLLEAGAEVTLVAPRVDGVVPDGVTLVPREYRRGDLDGTVLAVSATGLDEVNDAIVDEARARGVLLNVVDDPVRSGFFFTAVHRAGDVVVSVSTSGAAPALAQWLRDHLARQLPANVAWVAARLRDERRALHESGASTEGLDWRARVATLISEAARA
jgi:precorrin-2 dehydrogenase